MIALLLIAALLRPPTGEVLPSGGLPVYLVHGPGAPWTAARADAALAELRAALAWWAARTGDAPPLLEAPAALETPTPYERTAWMGTEPGIYLVARGADGPAFPNGRSGWARPMGLRLAALETPVAAPLGALLAHEWGHARYGLPDVDTQGDIMGPGYPGAYAGERVGCASGAALGRPCVYLPILRGAP